MSKEWKCTDCVKYKTDACSTCACGYTPTVSCRDVLVDFDYAYQQGGAETIDLVSRHLWNYSKEVWEDFKPILEQLKEQKNE